MMKVIQPNCRVQFTAQDVDFVLSVLGKKIGSAECLVNLLADEDTRDLILDDETLFHALLERGGCLRVSTRFYFYVLVRRVFKQSGVLDRAVADYVAEVLSEFAQAERGQCVAPGSPNPLNYLFEMLTMLEAADERTRFVIRVHVGNQSLFLAGVFPERIRYRAESRGFPDLGYYETMGRAQYRAASDHHLARRYRMSEILSTMAERFQTMRLALNDMSDRLLSLGESNSAIQSLLKPAFPDSEPPASA